MCLNCLINFKIAAYSCCPESIFYFVNEGTGEEK